jgi:hypothetical protein
MASGIPLQDGTTGNLAAIDTTGALRIAGEKAPLTNSGNVGAMVRMKLVDPGSQNPTGLGANVPILRTAKTSRYGRDAVGMDSLLDQEIFGYTTQNTNKFTYTFTTLTMAMVSQALQTNALGVTTLSTAAKLSSFHNFPIFSGSSPTIISCDQSFFAWTVTNTTLYVGLFLPGAASPYAPTDGIYWKVTNAGLLGAINYNGTETTVGPFTWSPASNVVSQYMIVVTDTAVEFWINGVLFGVINVPSGQGQPCMSASLPFSVVHAIGGTAAGAVQHLNLVDYAIFSGDLAFNKPFNIQAIDAGGNCLSGQPGNTQGQLGTYALGAAPGAVTLTASTAPATNTLGGLFTLPATITPAASDYPLFAWQNPSGKTFYCDSIIVVDMQCVTSLAGGPLSLQYAVGIGSTAATLATTESASFASATAKIARKNILGAQAIPVTMAAGSTVAGFQRMFPTPLPIQPGEFLHIILRVPAGTATSAGALQGGVFPTGFFA